MVEVFVTNVTAREDANVLVHRIHDTFTDHQANFDLDDCDHILRVECRKGDVQSTALIHFLKEMGFNAKVLPHEVQPIDKIPVNKSYY